MNKLARIILLITLLAACQTTPIATPTIQLSSTPDPTETPQPTATPTASPTPTIVPTPTTSPDTLEQQAAELCEQAFSAPVQTQPFEMPYLGMYKTEVNRNPSWGISNTTPHLFALSAESVKSIVCSSETRTQVGIYTDGSAAFKLRLNIRVVSWPDGAVVAAKSFESGMPPETKSGFGGGYGSYPPGMNVRDWLLEQLEHPEFLYFPRNGLSLVAAAPVGNLAATVRTEEEVQKILLFDPVTLQIVTTLESEDLGPINDLVFSPDAKTLISLGRDGMVRFWDLQIYQQTAALTFEREPKYLLFSPDGAQIAISAGDGVHLVQASTKELIRSFPSNMLKKDVAFSSDNSRLFINGPLNDEMGITQGINVMDAETGQQVSLFPDMSSAAVSISPEGQISFDVPFPTDIGNFIVAPQGDKLIAYDRDAVATLDPVTAMPLEAEHALHIWDPNTGQYLSEVQYFGKPAKIILFSPAGMFFVTGNGNQIWLWNADTWSVVRKLIGHVGQIVDLAFTPDGKQLLSSATDNTVRVWTLEP